MISVLIPTRNRPGLLSRAVRSLIDNASDPDNVELLGRFDADDPTREAGIELCFAELKDPVKDKLKRFGLFAQLGEEVFFPTVGAAVKQYVDTHPVDWEDWQERD